MPITEKEKGVGEEGDGFHRPRMSPGVLQLFRVHMEGEVPAKKPEQEKPVS